MPSATRKQFLARVKELGAELDETMERDCDQLLVDAPRGHVFVETGTACICSQYANAAGQSWKPQAYADLIEDMRSGVRKMDAEERERIEHEQDDDFTDVLGPRAELNPRE